MIRESLLAFTLMAGANGADYITTQNAIRAGGVELNTLYGPQAQRLASIKVLTITAETGIFLKLRKDGHKRAAWIWVGAVVVANLALAQHNRQIERKLRGA